MNDYSSKSNIETAISSSPRIFWSQIGHAFKRALVSQCHPSMLFALLLPFFIAFTSLIILLWFCWTPLTQWLQHILLHWNLLNQLDNGLITMGLFSLKIYLVPIVAMAIFVPFASLLGLIITAIFIMPIVLRHVSQRYHAHLMRQGEYSLLISGWNVVWVGLVFCVGWIITLPLWLLPPLGIFLSFFWWSFAFSRILRIDALVEHANRKERNFILGRHNGGFWTLGLICAMINLLPPAWIFLPVFSSLLFVHYGLQRLDRLRQTDEKPGPDILALSNY